VTKLMDFGSAVAEMERYGLLPGRPIAAVVILFQLTASAMVISGFLRWIGALSLAVFTLLATFIAFRFWEMPLGQDRFMGDEHLLRTPWAGRGLSSRLLVRPAQMAPRRDGLELIYISPASIDFVASGDTAAIAHHE
jgi:hypothetical protein